MQRKGVVEDGHTWISAPVGKTGAAAIRRGGRHDYSAISPQGRLAYEQRLLRAHIRRLELGGSHRVENMPMNSTRLDHVPQYSPDGKGIAFASESLRQP
jgi:hypothetical protein